jgi:hypothetical protein
MQTRRLDARLVAGRRVPSPWHVPIPFAVRGLCADKEDGGVEVVCFFKHSEPEKSGDNVSLPLLGCIVWAGKVVASRPS